MKKSRYFSDLLKSYLDEIDDLLTDTEGKSVLQRRLRDKRGEMNAILPMIEFSPEMVAVVFYEAFEFQATDVMHKLVQHEPELAGFLKWDELKTWLNVEAWAEPLIAATLAEDGGDAFLVTCAALEFLRERDGYAHSAHDEKRDEDSDDDEDADDLAEAGSEWLSEQGFDSSEH